MPRGGGGFGGGGFGGGGRGGGFGGFGGGGFRGGGHRGSSPGFRSGPSGGSPFGRTGAQRSVSRGPRGNNYYGRHGGYYGRYGRYGGGWGWGYGGWWGYRPWYGRGYWFWGRPYGSWYYSPVYIGGGFILFLLLLLLVIPMVGFMAVPYPASTTQDIRYSDTQTINYNEYWYESEYMSAGNTIDYSMQANGPVSFAIADHPFSGFPITTTRSSGSYSDQFTVNPNQDYQYVTFYLYTNDYLNYTFSSSGNLEFFIADGPNMQSWNNYQSSTLYKDNPSTSSGSGTFTAPHAQDWYLVWYNKASSGSPINVQVSVNYAISSLDLSQANVHVLDTKQVNPGTFTVPTSGTYYFFIYFDPALSSAQSVTTSFTVTYHQNLTSNDAWQQVSPLLIFLVIIIVVLLIIAIVQRSNAKRYEKQKKEQKTNSGSQSQGQTTQQVTVPTGGTGGGGLSASTTMVADTSPQATTASSDSKQRCHVCGNAYFPTDVFCPNCGTRLIGRDYGIPTKTTPMGSENCAVCGTHLSPGSKFCPDCGTQVK